MKRKYTLDERKFDTITADSAYWAGFIYGDGNIQENRLRLELCWEDRNHLFKFRNFMGSTHPVKEKLRENCHNGGISFRSWRITKALHKFGITDIKSKRGRLPLELLTSPYRREFIRGLIDADGSFYYDGHNKDHLFCEITGYLPVLKDVLNILRMEQVVVNKKIVKNGSVFRIRLAEAAATKLLTYLFKDNNSAFFLDRKKHLVDSHLERLNERAQSAMVVMRQSNMYHRPVSEFNIGKKAEFKERVEFDVRKTSAGATNEKDT